MIFMKNGKISLTKQIKILEKEAKKVDKSLEIPAWERIDRILTSLEKLGLVIRRYDPLKKGRHLWLINPEYLIYQKRKKR